MIIYVNRLLWDSQGHAAYELAESLGQIDYRGEKLSFNGPVSVTGCVEKDGDLFSVTGDINARVILACSRCLGSVIYPVKATFKQEYPEPGTEEEKPAAYRGRIDLEEPVIASILLELPIKVVCKEECRGLCPVCGLDRNIKECSCIQEETDPRMLKLKELLEE
jgi:uncharacterized protein